MKMSEILGLLIIICILSFIIWILILVIGWLWYWCEELANDIYEIEDARAITVDVPDSWIIKDDIYEEE